MHVQITMGNGDDFEVVDLPDTDCLALVEAWQQALRRTSGSETLTLTMDRPGEGPIVVHLNAALVSSIELM